MIALAFVGCAAAVGDATFPQDFPGAMRDAIWVDAARRTGVAASDLRLVNAAAVTWRDGAMGCPQPERMYTQALVPGWRVEIVAPSGASLLYHASRRGGWLWCPAQRAQGPLPGNAER